MIRTRALLVAMLAALGTLLLVSPVGPPPAPAQDVDRIDAAVKKGVAFLKTATWQFMDSAGSGHDKEMQDLGVAALAGMALLESDVDKRDASVQRAYGLVKRYADSVNKVYPLALSIMFLSRYNAAGDAPLIKRLCLRLMAAQNPNGGWTYVASVLTPDQERAWEKWFRDREKLTKIEDADANQGQFTPGGSGPDNSNTQFAILALWLGRKAGVPVKYALLRTEQRFRRTQQGDGGWGYGITLMDRSGAGMTCAGLLALAVGHGSSLERTATFRSGGEAGGSGGGAAAPPSGGLTLDQLQEDSQVKSARAYIESRIRDGRIEHFIYFIWSLERVCVVFDWNKDNWWDWYAWSSDLLVKRQEPDGSWSFEYGKSVDTALSLLVLRRANLLADLTKKARFVSDSGAQAIAGPKRPAANTPPPAEEKPSDGLPSDAKELAKELITATGLKREQIILKLRESKGGEFTTALATSIPQLSGTDQRLARDALAKRLERLTPSSLVGYMEETDKELQLAAARAAGAKRPEQAKELAPPLIALLDNFEDNIKDAAYESLKSLSGEDYGRSASTWKAWWSKKFGE